MTAKRASADHELPDGWRRLGPEEAAGRLRVLKGEMSAHHPLSGVDLEATAARTSNDDVLYRHVSDPARLTIVHLTWTGRRQTTPDFPSVEFDGSYAEFLEQERRLAAGQDA
jgi:hypothetical protein